MKKSFLRGIALLLLVSGATAAFIAISKSKPAAKPHPPSTDPWVLVNYDPDTKYGTYLGNGYIATRIMGDGLGHQCFMAGEYHQEKICPIANWAELSFYYGLRQFQIDKNEPYKQSLNMRTGIVNTEATWRAGSKTLKGSIQILASRDHPDIALIQTEFIPDFDEKVTFRSPVAGNAGTTSLSGYVVPVVNGKPFSCSLNINMQYTLVGYFSQGSSAKTINAHKAAMAKIWQHDIIIDGPIEDQQAIHACMFYLLQSVCQGSRTSIPPMGLSSDGYQGHIFWDADTWMFPALILQHPELAKSIVEYRYSKIAEAWGNAHYAGFDGVQYPWESAVTGMECCPEGLNYRNERHINGDVALAQWQYYLATGDLKWLRKHGYSVIEGTADWWASKATLDKQKNKYVILKIVPPDENAEIQNNSAYTNAIAQINLKIAIQAAKLLGKSPNPKWQTVADKLYIPYDAKNKRFIAYDNYKGYTAKQADTELLAYPLQFTLPGQDMTEIYRKNFEYYAPKVHKNGPAMTSSAHSVILARLGDSDAAYKAFQESYKPFFRGSFNMFNEKRSTTWDNMCFLTGAAGPIQATIFGLAGAKIDYFPSDPSKPELTFHPCLPKAWKSLKLTGIQWRGKTFDVIIDKSNKATILPR